MLVPIPLFIAMALLSLIGAATVAFLLVCRSLGRKYEAERRASLPPVLRLYSFDAPDAEPITGPATPEHRLLLELTDDQLRGFSTLPPYRIGGNYPSGGDVA